LGVRSCLSERTLQLIVADLSIRVGVESREHEVQIDVMRGEARTLEDRRELVAAKHAVVVHVDFAEKVDDTAELLVEAGPHGTEGAIRCLSRCRVRRSLRHLDRWCGSGR
jgi:hypothetical protein